MASAAGDLFIGSSFGMELHKDNCTKTKITAIYRAGANRNVDRASVVFWAGY